jgi:hypothetical protein
MTLSWLDTLDNMRGLMRRDYETAHVPQAQAVLQDFDTRPSFANTRPMWASTVLGLSTRSSAMAWLSGPVRGGRVPHVRAR